jgi:hypothetical protein
MKSTQIEQVLQRMSNFTASLNADLESFSNTDFKSLSVKERNDFLREIEHFEILTSKAEAISQKTSREGVPEIIANKEENTLDNKLENQAAPKKRASNLMKPGLTNTPSNNSNKKDKK